MREGFVSLPHRINEILNKCKQRVGSKAKEQKIKNALKGQGPKTAFSYRCMLSEKDRLESAKESEAIMQLLKLK